MGYDYREAMKLGNQLCFPLYAAARSVTGLYTPHLKPLGLTYTQYIVFLVLWERDGVTVGSSAIGSCWTTGLCLLCSRRWSRRAMSGAPEAKRMIGWW